MKDVGSAVGATTNAAGSLLERRYRRWLAVLPRGYRELREQEMVDAFLESRYADDPDMADVAADYGHPSVGEVGSVLGLALRLRWGGADAPVRSRVRTSATQMFALLALLIMAQLAILGVVARLSLASLPQGPRLFGPGDFWDVVRSSFYLFWIPAFLAAVFGRARWAQILGLLALAPQVMGALRDPSLLGSWAWPLVGVVAIVALGAFRRDTSGQPRWGWLVAAGAGAVALQGIRLLPHDVARWLVIDEASLWTLAVVLAMAVLLMFRPRMSDRRVAEFALCLAGFSVCSIVLGAAHTADLMLWIGTSEVSTPVNTHLAHLVIAFAILIGSASGTVVRVRRLPPVSYALDSR